MDRKYIDQIGTHLSKHDIQKTPKTSNQDKLTFAFSFSHQCVWKCVSEGSRLHHTSGAAYGANVSVAVMEVS